MKLYRLLTILLLVVCFNTSAQNELLNGDSFWEKVKLDRQVNIEHIKAADTVIVIASNRTMQPGDMRFMGERRDNNKIRYFFVYTYRHEWHVLQTVNLQEAIKYMPDKNKDWVVYTEGMGKLFPSDIYRGMGMAGTYKVNVLMLDYPSITTKHGLYRNYLFAIHNARIAYKDLGPVLDSVKKLKTNDGLGSGHLTLFFHSMGNNVMSKLVQHGMLPMLNNTEWADNLVLNAPCVKERHHRKWVDKIHFAKRIYINYNPNDKTLGGAHLASFKKQLGEKVRKPISKNATYINFSLVAGERHSNFLTLVHHAAVINNIMAQYQLLLHGDTLQVHDTHLYAPSAYRGIGWGFATAALRGD